MGWVATFVVVLVFTPWKGFSEAHEGSVSAMLISILGMITVSLVMWPSILHEVWSTIDNMADDGTMWVEVEDDDEDENGE